MTDPERTTPTRDTTGINRRRVLKTLGGAAVGFVAVTGTASAHQSKFFDCQRVCTGTHGSYAVVAVDDAYQCREMTADSDHEVPWDWQPYCYEAASNETVVGLIEENVIVGGKERENGTCTLCLNPNDCATAAYENASAVVDALNANDGCGVCAGNVVVGDDCTVYSESSSDDSGGNGGSDGGDGSDGSDGSDDDDGSDGSDGSDDGDGSNGSDGSDGNDDSNDHESDNNSNSATEAVTNDPQNSAGSQNSDGSNRGGNDDFDIYEDYSDDRDFSKDHGDVTPQELAERRQSSGDETDCEPSDDDLTAMERWYLRDDTPDHPDICTATEEETGTRTAMERWYARLDTPSRPVDTVRSLLRND
jgi:hypothetical protein